MKASEIRENYIKYFKGSPRNHAEISPAPLVLENDSTTLFTSAGMQPLVPYLLGKNHPKGRRLVNSQPSLRLGDVEEVGDNRHTTFFEMLGNWSLGDYFKKDQLAWILEFFTKEINLPKERLWISVFEGSKQVPKDDDSFNIWKSLGIPEKRIYFYPSKKNWWSMTGSPEEMQVGHIGGPDSEIFYDFGEKEKFHENSLYRESECHPNCECGRFLEIGNSVFIQYRKISDEKLKELPQKNVDFGGGLERIAAAVNNTPDIFLTDLFNKIIDKAQNLYGVEYEYSEEIRRSLRIIADHTRAVIALISAGITPSNKTHGYILRRLIRRALIHARKVSGNKSLILPIIDLSYAKIPLNLKSPSEINNIVEQESVKFTRVMEDGIKKLEGMVKSREEITGEKIFDLYQNFGFPIELSMEILSGHGVKFSEIDKAEFNKVFEKHKEISRTTSAGIFKGGLADHSPQVVRLHTATHLLLASLRKIVGEHIVQKGQNITKDRTRFDFPNPEKLSDRQIVELENMINGIIDKNLKVGYKVLAKEKALATGAVHAFNEKYSDTVKVFYIGKDIKNAFSKEFCGGPHVSSTSEIGHVKIDKQEKIGSGIIRIYASIV